MLSLSVWDTHSRPRSPALWFFDIVIVFDSSAIAYHKHHTHTPFTTVPHNHTRRAYLNAYSHCMAFSRCQVIITFYSNDFFFFSTASFVRSFFYYRFNSLRFVFGLDACVNLSVNCFNVHELIDFLVTIRQSLDRHIDRSYNKIVHWLMQFERWANGFG